MKNSYLFTRRNVYVSGAPERSSSYSESAMWEKYAKEDCLEVINNPKIEFTEGNKRGLVARLTDVYLKQLGGKHEAKAKANAMALTGKLVMKAKSLPGFDVNYFKAGDSLKFSGEEVIISYTPRGATELRVVTINYMNKDVLRTVAIDKTRTALEGQRNEVLLEACKREVLYNVVSVMGYKWGDNVDMTDFWQKLSTSGFDNSSITMLAPNLKGSAQKNVAACRFIKELLSGEDTGILGFLMKGGTLSQLSEVEEVPSAEASPQAEQLRVFVSASPGPSLGGNMPIGGVEPAEDLPYGQDIESQWTRLKTGVIGVKFDIARKHGITYETLEDKDEIKAAIPRRSRSPHYPVKAIKFSKGGVDRYIIIYKTVPIGRGMSLLKADSGMYEKDDNRRGSGMFFIDKSTSGADFMSKVNYALKKFGVPEEELVPSPPAEPAESAAEPAPAVPAEPAAVPSDDPWDAGPYDDQ